MTALFEIVKDGKNPSVPQQKNEREIICNRCIGNEITTHSNVILNRRNQTQRITNWFYLYEVQKQAKLTCEVRNQNDITLGEEYL